MTEGAIYVVVHPMKEVVKKKKLKLLNDGVKYQILDSIWVCHVQVVQREALKL